MDYKKIISLLFFLAVAINMASAQFDKREEAYDYSKDTLYIKYLNEVEITANSIFSDKKNVKRFTRLVHYVKKVYPYAMIAAAKLKDYEAEMATMSKKRQKRRYMRGMEAELKKEFGLEISRFTYMQGEIFLKLLDRETHYTGYELLKMLRGGFRARIYQHSADMFGFDLKERYDPTGKDKEIEEIVNLIQKGEI